VFAIEHHALRFAKAQRRMPALGFEIGDVGIGRQLTARCLAPIGNGVHISIFSMELAGDIIE